MVAVLAAKRKTLLDLQSQDPSFTETQIKNRLVAYTSDQSNSSVEKSAIIGDVAMRHLPSDEEGVLRGETLMAAIKRDIAEGYIPCCVSDREQPKVRNRLLLLVARRVKSDCID